MDTEWRPAAVLPNVRIKDSIKFGGLVALLRPSDHIITTLTRKHPQLREFLRRFVDAFNEPQEPGVLVLAENAPQSYYTAEAVAGFRDLISMSVIPYNRALSIQGMSPRINFSDTFNFYPWMLDRNYEYIIAHTPAQLGLHEVNCFRGQVSPEVCVSTLTSQDIDQPLLEALLRRWRRRFDEKPVKHSDRALFRSLNMGNKAAQVPGSSDTTEYDFGRSIALWVSALEILAHPLRGDTNFKVVSDLIEKVRWQTKECAQHRYAVYWGRTRPGKRPPRRVLAVWLYGEIYKARNDFLHGNPVRRGRITMKNTKGSLFQYAAVLCRLGLTGFLDLHWNKTLPSLNRPKAFGAAAARSWEFEDYQYQIERAVHSAR